MKFKFQNNVPLETWKRGPSQNSKQLEYAEAIKDMKVGQSFEFSSPRYQDQVVMHSAFKSRGWRGAMRSRRNRAPNDINRWTFRFWRVA